MSRQSTDQHVGARLINGFDYENQDWVGDGKYIRQAWIAVAQETKDIRRQGQEAKAQADQRHD